MKQLLAIQELSQKYPRWKHRDIFRILNKDDIWIAAYENLKGNKSAIAFESSSETINGMSLERLQQLKKIVRTEQYKFEPVKLNYIPKTNGRIRPLGLPTVNDKIVQEVIRIILETIYEPIFYKVSFGFRRGEGCHNALAHVESTFQGVDYVIGKDIEQPYPNIDHHSLVRCLEQRIEDSRFIRLVWKVLKCGVLNQEILEFSRKGVPQGSIVSPILTSIYYHELDRFVHSLKEQYETPESKRTKPKSLADKRLEHQIQKISEIMRNHEPQSQQRKSLAKELKALRKNFLQTLSLKDKTIRIEYVRYADDWMVGISGDRKLTVHFKQKLSCFMKNDLGQKLRPEKTKITNLRKGNAQFLGYQIFLPRIKPILMSKGKGAQIVQRGQPQLRFDIPVTKVVKRYIDLGYLRYLQNQVRPISRGSYTVLEDHVIVSHYRNIWLDLLNYYSGCTNRRRLQYFHYLLHMSCSMTLAHRHRISSSKVLSKYGKWLTVKLPQKDGKTVSFPHKMTWKIRKRKWLLGKMLLLPIY